jgi:nitrogen fixation NifU-like protein
MSELRDLYQEVILDHYKHPRNFRVEGEGYRHADGYNPLCGDRVTVFVKVADGVISDVAFQGSGCAISTASGSMLTEAMKGRSVEEAEALFGRFHDLVTGRGDEDGAELGKLAVFAGVRDYPARVKCATLCWHALRAAMEERTDPVTTE